MARDKIVSAAWFLPCFPMPVHSPPISALQPAGANRNRPQVNQLRSRKTTIAPVTSLRRLSPVKVKTLGSLRPDDRAALFRLECSRRRAGQRRSWVRKTGGSRPADPAEAGASRANRGRGAANPRQEAISSRGARLVPTKPGIWLHASIAALGSATPGDRTRKPARAIVSGFRGSGLVGRD